MNIIHNIAAALLIPSLSIAGCPQFFYNHTQPRSTEATINICHKGFAVGYSPRLADPVWSAEHLTREHRYPGRFGGFHPDPLLPKYYPHLTARDYKNTHMYDRGHMAPNGDQPTASLKAETFVTTNIVPQDADDNEYLHEGIEKVTRKLADQYGSIYVVTGPLFWGKHPRRLNHMAMIPTHIFKAIIIPGMGGAAYIERNKASNEYSIVSLNTLSAAAGIDVAPKTKIIRLPKPTPSRHQTREVKKEKPPKEIPFDKMVLSVNN